MNQKNNRLKPRTQHNADAAYYVLDYLAHELFGNLGDGVIRQRSGTLRG